MADRVISSVGDYTGYDAAVSIDAAADYLLIQQSSTYKKINRNVLLGVTGTPMDTSTAQNVTNKTLDTTNTVALLDTLFSIKDNSDPTKIAQFQLSGLTTGTTRTYTLPNASSTLMDLASSQTVTGVKTLTAPIISGGSIANSTITVDSIGEYTAAAGVTVDGVLLKDGAVVSPTITGATINTSTSNSQTLNTPIVATPTMRNWDGWQDAAETWTYASATTITVPSDATTKYAVGDKIKLTQSATVKYFYIVAVAATTLTITGGSDYTLTNNTISSNFYSHQSSPLGFPNWMAYSSTITGYSATATNLTRFRIDGRGVTLSWRLSGTSNSTSFSATLPVTAANVSGYIWQQFMYAIDNGTASTVSDYAGITAAGSSVLFSHADNNAGWTASGTKATLGQMVYEI
jgi:hypothetical protein